MWCRWGRIAAGLMTCSWLTIPGQSGIAWGLGRGGRGGGRPPGGVWGGRGGALSRAPAEDSVVAGWRPHVLSVLDALSAQRRDLEDRLGLEGELLRAVAEGPASFGDLVAATRLPAVARAHALHMLWRRRLGTDLACPLGDGSLVWLARGTR